jgi:hypothetical protein
MFALEIRVNGELKATCGTDDIDFLGGVLRAKRMDTASSTIFDLQVECMGVRPVDANTREVVKWVQERIQLGDEIAFRFVDVAHVNPPIDRQAIPASGSPPDA